MDEKRILSKIGEIDSYLQELVEVAPSNFENYSGSIEKKRSCERILQISIESVLDVCYILFSELNLGVPNNDEGIISKLVKRKVISKKAGDIVREMKGFRNILVHKYGVVDDEKVFELLENQIGDFDIFKREVLKFLKK